MPKNFSRCRYVDSNSIECAEYYEFDESLQDDTKYLCPIHRGTVSSDLAANGINKSAYITKRQELEKACSEMSLSELDVHIAGLEKVYEEAKLALLVAKGQKGFKLDQLTEEERKERRKIQTPKVERVKKEKTAKPETDVKGKIGKAIQSMMNLGMTEEAAKKALGVE